jgi:hypothetical protein
MSDTAPTEYRMRFESTMSPEAAMKQLTAAVTQPTLGEALSPRKTRLAGQVSRSRTVIYRKRGLASYYGRFEGAITDKNGRTVLAGSFIRNRSRFIKFCVGFLVVWAILVVFVAIFRWQGLPTVAFLIFAAAATAIAIGIVRFRELNVQAEIELLAQEIREVLARSGG